MMLKYLVEKESLMTKKRILTLVTGGFDPLHSSTLLTSSKQRSYKLLGSWIEHRRMVD